MLLLIKKGADPKKINSSGKNFFDIIIDDEDIEPKLTSEIKAFLQVNWKKQSSEELQKARATYPFLPETKPDMHRSPLDIIALLVHLKKERRLANNSDYECTVLAERKQLDSFIQLAKLRFEATKIPFEIQFIMRPRDRGIHIANGHLRFDNQGNTNVLWIDTLGHNDFGWPNFTRYWTEEVMKTIRKHLPQAILYTTDITIQSTETGCQNIAMYVSEQLSIATRKQFDLFVDLNKIYQHNQREENGIRIIPWAQCPAYTGIPRIIQSASKPLARIQEDLEEDQLSINKKGQNYQEAMKPYLVEKQGKIVNITYDTKRQKFGTHIAEAYENHYAELNKKRFSGFTDLVDRIPINALAKKLEIEITQQKDKTWKIAVSPQHQSSYLSNLQGTLLDLTLKLNEAYQNITTDKEAFTLPNFLFYYAAIRAIREQLRSLVLENEKPLISGKAFAVATAGFFGAKPERIFENDGSMMPRLA